MVAAAIGASAVTSVVGGVMQSDAAGNAADAQVAANDRAIASTDARYQAARNDLLPFMDFGREALGQINNFGAPIDADRLAQLTTPYGVQWDPKSVENTPGYQFTREQGLKSVQNSAAARGLGSSGNALRGAADYATGLANSTYNDQYNNYLKGLAAYLGQNSQIFNMLLGANSQQYNQLMSRAQLGANAAAQSGGFSATASGQINNALINQGNAQASGELGSAAALSNGFQGAGSAGMNYFLFNQLLNKPVGTPGTGVPPSQYNFGNYTGPSGGYVP